MPDIVIVHKDCGGEATYDSFGNYKCNKCGFTSKDENLIEVFESGKRLWYLPLSERFIGVDPKPFSSRKLMELDGIGFMLEYDDKNPEHLEPDFIRRHLVGVRDTHTYIYADTREEAVKKFQEGWEGAKMGTKSKALWINEERGNKIFSVAYCDRINFDEEKFTISCGHPDPDDEYDNPPGCTLDHFDAPDDCPVVEQANRRYFVRRTLKYKPKKHDKYKKYGGGKTGTVCPHCGNLKTFIFQGRYKGCTSCGYNNLDEKRVSLVKWHKNRGMVAKLETEFLEMASDYASKMSGW